MKLEDITYRRARTGDSEIIKRILKTTLDEYDIKLPEKYTFSDIEDLEEEYIHSSGEFIVLLRGQKIIGFFALRPSGNNQIELKRLYLKADERGRGLGRHLLNMALKIAKESGYVRIHLETTSKFIEAVALYRKFGFKTNVGATLSQGHEIGLKRDL